MCIFIYFRLYLLISFKKDKYRSFHTSIFNLILKFKYRCMIVEVYNLNSKLANYLKIIDFSEIFFIIIPTVRIKK